MILKNKSKRAAMEMSMGTVVTIILLVSVLVLSLVMIKNIFGGGNNAITSMNNQLSSKVNQLFSDGKTRRVAILPDSRKILVKRGKTPPEGFAFSIHNDAKEGKSFNYTVTASNVADCNGQITLDDANSYIIGKSTAAPINLGGGQNLENAILVLFDVPKNAPPCTVPYVLNVYEGTQPYDSTNIYVTYK